MTKASNAYPAADYQPQPQMPAQPAKKKHHIFRWFFLALQALFILWIVTGANATKHGTNCGTLSQTTCDQAAHVGGGIGIALIIIVWFIVDVVVLLARMAVLLSRRNDK